MSLSISTKLTSAATAFSACTMSRTSLVGNSQSLENEIRQKRTGEPVGQVLKTLGFVREEDLEAVLAEDMGVPFVSLSDERIERAARANLDVEWLTEKCILPMREERGILVVAMGRPSDVEVLDTLQKRLGKPIKVVAATPSEIRVALKGAVSGDGPEPLMNDAGNADLGYDAIQRITRLRVLSPGGASAPERQRTR